jgi:hypothetical protein
LEIALRGPLSKLWGRRLNRLASFPHFLFKLPPLDTPTGFSLHVFENALFMKPIFNPATLKIIPSWSKG